MSPTRDIYDLLVIGAGPAGHKAALEAAGAGHSVLLIDRDATPGGECVHRGTIPSKTLRESALYLAGLKQRAAGLAKPELDGNLKVAGLMKRLEAVLRAHEGFMRRQIDSAGIEFLRGRARFLSPDELEVVPPIGTAHRMRGRRILLATGSRPRQAPEMNLDHENILDSDSILSLIYLPRSLTVLGAGVIACEFATIFQALGVQVTMIDKAPRPLGFLDGEITARFVAAFERMGGRFLGNQKPTQCRFDGVSQTITTLENGQTVVAEKTLVALGRVASVHGLALERAGLKLSERGILPVDESCRTGVPHIYAAGDLIGPPALAASSMEQGRRAARHALGLPLSQAAHTIPSGIYTIPEMASVGLTEAQANERHGSVLVGRAEFGELARGQISGDTEGLLKLYAEPKEGRIVGAQIIGDGATELIHLAQLALVGNHSIELFVEQVFNFPTMAEAYRVAALDLMSQRARRNQQPCSKPAEAA